MENASDPNFKGGGEDELYKPYVDGSLPNMELEALFGDQVIEDFVYRSGLYINQDSEQDLQLATEIDPVIREKQLGQRQQLDISSDRDSHSKRNISDPLARKRAYDKVYRDRLKENQKRMKSTLDSTEKENGELKRENECLKNENGLVNQKYKTQSKEMNELRNNFEELKQRIKNQNENEQKMESTLKTLEAEIKSLKEENVTVNIKCKTQSKELGKLKKKSEKQHQLKSNMKTLGVEIESLKGEKALESQRFENELAKLKKKCEKQLERKRQLKSNLKTLEAENGRLKNEIIEFLKYGRVAGSRTNFIGDFEQYPNEETEASPQVVPAIPYFGT